MPTIQNLTDGLLEVFLGTPGSAVDTPEQKQRAQEARKKATQRIIEERNNRGGGATKKVGGKTVADLGLGEKLVTGEAFGENTNAATEVQKGVGELQEIGRTEDFVNKNQDSYPELKDYDTSSGYKGAEEIVKKKNDLLRGTQRLEDLGLSIETLNSTLGKSGLTQLDPDTRYTTAQLAPYITQYNKQTRTEERAPELKLLTDKLQEEIDARESSDQRAVDAQQEAVDARESSDQRADDAQTDLQEYRLYESRRRAHESEQDRLRRAHELKVQQSEGKANRSQTFDLAVMQLQNNNADRMYRREADERQTRRDERKDRQLMILQLMKGLQQMGQSFTI